MYDIDTKIKKYRILGPGEEGNYSVVYRAEDREGRTVALKCSKEPRSEYDELIGREFQVLSRVQHPNVVKALEFDVCDDDTPFFTMEYVPGTALNKAFSGYSKELARALVQVLAGIAAFHDRGLVHTDLKPEHIIYDPRSGRPVIIDFGFAGASAPGLDPSGTLGYIAPEVLKGLTPHQRSDLYSLGVIIFEILTGRKPTGPDDPIPNAKEEIRRLVQRLLSEEPCLRPTLPEIHQAFSLGLGQVRPPSYRVELPAPAFMDRGETVERIRSEKKTISVLLGPAGSGKSRILKEIKFRLQRSGVRVFSHRAEGMTGLLEILSASFGIKTDPGRDKFAAFENICRAMASSAEKQPLALVLDDVDDLADSDLDLINYLAVGLASAGVRLFCSARGDRDIRLSEPSIRRLSPFSKSEVRELVERTFPAISIRDRSSSIPTDDLGDWLHERTGGIPLGIIETLKYLQNQSVLEYGQETWQLDWHKMMHLSVPSRIEEILTGLLDRLPDGQRELMAVMSVIDCPAEPALLAKVQGRPIDFELEGLKRLGLVREEFENRRRTALPASGYIASQVKRSLSPDERRRICIRIFDAFAGSAGGDESYLPLRGRVSQELGRDREALELFLKTGECQERKYDYPSALDAFNQAAKLSRKADPGRYHALRLRAAGLMKNLGMTEPARAAYQEVVESGPAEVRPAALTEYGRFLCSIGEFEPGADVLTRSRQIMAEGHPDYIKTLNSLGYALMMTGRAGPASELFSSAMDRSRIRGDRTGEATALYNQSALAWRSNDLERAMEVGRTGLEFARSHALDFDLGYFADLLTTCCFSRNDLAQARTYNDLAIDVFTRSGHVQLLNHALQNRSSIMYDEGDLAGSEKVLEKTLARAVQMNNREDRHYAYFNIGIIREFKGRFADALEHYRRATEIKPEDDAPAYRAAAVRFKLGDLEQARQAFLELDRTRVDPQNHVHLALIHSLLAEWPEAHAELERAQQILSEDPAPHKLAFFLESSGRIHIEEGDQARARVCAERLKRERPADRYSINLAEAFLKLSRFGAGEGPALDLDREEAAFRDMGYLYELGLLKRLRLAVLCRGDRPKHWPAIAACLTAGNEIFRSLGCRAELDALQRQQSQILAGLNADFDRRAFSDSYLETFSKLAELIDRDLGHEGFPDQVLDLVIRATRAERGALFLKRGRTMDLACGRGLDRTTLDDAEEFSLSVLNKMERADVVFVPNALANPDFSLKKSVILNQIRSILCIPLAVGGTVIGAIYLDSRVPDRGFDPRDRDFLLAVSRILASVIEKSYIFSATRDENVLLRSNLIREIGNGYLVGKSRAMKKVYRKIEDTAGTDLPILIHGETGTGKGMIARLIHLKSGRRDKRFLTINCGTIPETILESELFGHKKGSFTGAVSDKRGLLEEAEAGTVFLDEITNTSQGFQAKLLEAIEEKSIRRVGETVTRKIDVRFLFATNRDLEIEVEEGRFRKDLYYRINVFEIEVPPLRERRSDIPQLAQLFLERFRQEINKPIEGFADEAMDRLKNNHWPGNVRELQNVIERSVIQARSRLIVANDIGIAVTGEDGDLTIKDLKKEAILAALRQTNWNVQAAAKALGINRRTIQRLIKTHQIKK